MANTDRYLYSIDFYNAIKPISKELKLFIKAKTRFMHLKKGDYINQIGEVCDKLMIINKGMVRGFFMHGAQEITTWISYDGQMATSISGYFKHKKSLENIQCLEDSSIEYLHYEDLLYCLEKIPESIFLNRILMEEYLISAERRAFIARIPLAKDRYQFYKENVQEDILKRIPKKHLASLLNMKPETLARIIHPKK